MITSQDLRQRYIDFFLSKGHQHIPSSSLVPSEDPTVLFTTAGMHPLVPFLMGENHPMGKRLVNYQKCVRTGDIDEVGDSSHLTFFEMLGNWSLGDYFKQDAIAWSFEFLTQSLKIPLERLAVTCFVGDQDAPRDLEAAKIWENMGIPKNRIFFLPKKDNWWGPAGTTGPCGPDTEMFYVFDPSAFDNIAKGTTEGFRKADEKKLMVEIWNDVFMQYNKTPDGKFEPLKQKNVDTGMGLERTLCVLNGFTTVYETDLFQPMITSIAALAKNKNDIRSMRIIADHIRSATFMAADHVRPSNLGQGYVMRRLIRRAIRHGKMIGIEQHFLINLSQIVIDRYGDIYPELKRYEGAIQKTIFLEEERFSQTLQQGLREFERLMLKLKEFGISCISGEGAFMLYDTYGFPIEMTQDLVKENQMQVDLEGFRKAFEKHQKLSRTLSAGVFKGGLADHSAESTRLHTATHLLHQALRTVLGDHVYQRGSHITKERLRLDFTHSKKMTPEEIQRVEVLVNKAIQDGIEVTWQEMTFEDAKKYGAIGLFEDKYSEKVKVYTIGNYSKEVCGGPHANNTRELGGFKIMKEESCGAGLRRIKATVLANKTM